MTADILTIASLERWVLFGAHWRVVHLSDERAVIDLCTCMGEPVERLESEDLALIRYVRLAQSDPMSEASETDAGQCSAGTPSP
jgi:hypothetical protein